MLDYEEKWRVVIKVMNSLRVLGGPQLLGYWYSITILLSKLTGAEGRGCVLSSEVCGSTCAK